MHFHNALHRIFNSGGESISRETHHPTTSESFETVRANTLPALDTETVVTPVKASEPDSDAEGANADTKAEAWKEGDLVEGLCHLSDGSSRYFAGKLVAVASKQRKVSIRYNDGEEQHDKPMDEIRVPKAIMIKRRMELKKKGLNPGALKVPNSAKSRTSGLSSPEQDKGSSTPPRPTSGIKVLQPPIRSVSPRTRMGLKSNQDQRESKCLLTSNLSTGGIQEDAGGLSSRATESNDASAGAVKTLFLVNDDGAAHEEDDKEQ